MPTWMIVEDEPDIQEMVGAMFAIWGVSGIAFADGQTAIDWISQIEYAQIPPKDVPDLALLDIRLPNRTGVEVAMRLRQCALLDRLVIVLMTAYQLTPDQETQMLALTQADALVYKPLPAINSLHQHLEALVVAKKEGRLSGPLRIDAGMYGD